MGLVGNRATAADIVHDTFLRAAPRIGGLREPDRLRAWLFAILRNEAMDVLRARGREHPGMSRPRPSNWPPTYRNRTRNSPARSYLTRTDLPEGNTTGTLTLTATDTGRHLALPLEGEVERRPSIAVQRYAPVLSVPVATGECKNPQRGTVAASITDESGIAEATVSWSGGQAPMVHGGLWYGSYGSFAAPGTYTVTVRATDTRKNTATTTFDVTVGKC